MYTTPNQYYFRLHHIRPRFKGDVENVLIYIASEISSIGELPTDDFIDRINQAIYNYPGNAHRSIKTINNWRTEISSLFGFIISEDGLSKPGKRSYDLAQKQDLIEMFKMFLYLFQYPGAHIKPEQIQNQIQNGIKFKPAQYILKVLQSGEAITGKRVGLTKAEVCHCIFNDLRCIRDNENTNTVWTRIQSNRNNSVHYDESGDIIRYAGDILDYMQIANLLITHNGKYYYLNELEFETISKFTNSTEWFDGYDHLIKRQQANLNEINLLTTDWFYYVNRDIVDTDFTTDILALVSTDSQQYEELKKSSADLFVEKIYNGVQLSTKDIGDMGEAIIHSHECTRVKNSGREDLVHLIKRIPTQFAVGYDIQSVDSDAHKRYIEVKTTISSKPLNFNKVHLTRNEWNTASSVKGSYYIYRLMISKTERKLYVLRDPVALYKNDIISMVPNDGAEITFDTTKAGDFEELLSWGN